MRSIKNQVGTDPPLLVLLSVHHDHLALGERQLVRVVGHTVVDGFHSLRSLFLENKTHGDALVSVQSLVRSSPTSVQVFGLWEEAGGTGRPPGPLGTQKLW